jgi:hypothetical protein
MGSQTTGDACYLVSSAWILPALKLLSAGKWQMLQSFRTLQVAHPLLSTTTPPPTEGQVYMNIRATVTSHSQHEGVKRLPFILVHRSKSVPRQLSRYSDSLRAGRSGDRSPVRANFSSLLQSGSGAHSAWGYGSYSQGVKRTGRGINHPPPFNAEAKERVELYFYSSSGPSWCALGRTLPLPET